jgi:serine phosphatase RsbU (regulator of sigma subunit)
MDLVFYIVCALLLGFVVGAIWLYARYRAASLELKLRETQNQELTRNLSLLSSQIKTRPDPSSMAEDKKRLEDKNKKLFAMSETVYKEKKKVDEANEKLQQEKEKLAADKAKVDEKVKKLWSQSMAIHKEKERINELKLVIEHKHQEVMDSVTYAKRIQEAILPDTRDIDASFPQSFVLFKPRDIVSGDFYWFSHKDDRHIIAAVDCTGHGVPGAFMSMIGNTLLNQIVNEKGVTDPGAILHRLNEEVNRALKQTHEESQSRDGMDVAICMYDFSKNELQYAGANRPLYLVKDGALEEIKADKFPIGGRDYDVPKQFNTRAFALQKNDTVYISTDGFADQFNADDRKLMTKNFKNLLVSIQDKPMHEQKTFLDNYIESWKGSMEQTDDILVIGVRI